VLSPTIPFRPPAPVPQPRPLGPFALLRALRRNPLECWTAAHFDEPIVEGGFPFARVAVVSDPAAIHEVLVEHPSEYPKSALERRVLAAWLRNGLVVAEGTQWQRQRRTLTPVTGRKAATAFAPVITAAAAALVERWRSRADMQVIDVKREMSRFALNVILRCMFGEEPGEDLESVRHAMTTFFAVSGRVDPFDVVGLPDAVPRFTLWRARRIFTACEEVLDGAIARRRAGARTPADMLVAMMGARDPHSGCRLDTAEVKANLLTAFFAGQETTSTALTWSLYLIAQSREWSERVRREADATAGAPAEEITNRLVETPAVAKEALRLYPPIVGITRTLRSRRTLAGHDLKAGTMIVISPYVLHRHRRLWDEPDVFDPNRFLENPPRPVARYSYLPFGVGPRMCIGAAFAQEEMSLVLAAIVRHFALSPAPGQTVWPVQRFTLRPRDPLLMTAAYRG
jgi:cytochrome P450